MTYTLKSPAAGGDSFGGLATILGFVFHTDCCWKHSYRAEAVDDTPEPMTTTVNSVIPIFEGVPGKLYWFWVAASNASGESDLSEPDSGFIALPTLTFTLSVQKTGNGSGHVTSSPAGINCGATCTANFTQGTVITLTATRAANSAFIGWQGACIGTGDCILTIDSDTTVTATFNKDSTGEQQSKIYIPMTAGQ